MMTLRSITEHVIHYVIHFWSNDFGLKLIHTNWMVMVKTSKMRAYCAARVDTLVRTAAARPIYLVQCTHI